MNKWILQQADSARAYLQELITVDPPEDYLQVNPCYVLL